MDATGERWIQLGFYDPCSDRDVVFVDRACPRTPKQLAFMRQVIDEYNERSTDLCYVLGVFEVYPSRLAASIARAAARSA